MKVHISFGALLLIISSFFSENKIIFLIYLICAMIHELGHICAAWFLKIKLRKISLDFAGARIYPENNLRSYRKEWLLCAAGPLVNFITAFLAVVYVRYFFYSSVDLKNTITFMLDGVNSLLNMGETCSEGIAGLFFVLSLFQASVNLLPIDTLDGGRMMRCVVASILDEKSAQKLISAASFVFALLLWMTSVYLLIRTNAGLAIFVFSICMFLKVMNRDNEL